jgi:hypothetical protein
MAVRVQARRMSRQDPLGTNGDSLVREVMRSGPGPGHSVIPGTVTEVNRLLKQFEDMKKMMKQMTGMQQKGKKKGGFKLPFKPF